jgi:hypothetical protein
MRTRRSTTLHHLRAISVVDLFTQHPIQLNADRSDLSLPYGFSVPVPASASGLTLAFYTKLEAGRSFDGFYPILEDGGIGGGMNSQYTTGIFNGGLFVNGSGFGYGPRYLYAAGQFQSIILRSADGAASTAGQLYFNMNTSQPRDQLLAGPSVAYVNIWYKQLTLAEIAAPAFPSDADQRYIFNGFNLGDTTVVEQRATGLDATIYY